MDTVTGNSSTSPADVSTFGLGADSWKEEQCKADPYEEKHQICALSGNGGKPDKKSLLLILNNFSPILLR